MSRPTPRRPASSRGTTPRPRRIAGQAPTSPSTSTTPDEPVEPVEEAAAPARRGISLSKREKATETTRETTPVTTREPAPRPGPQADGGRPGVLARPKTTRVLIGVLCLVTLALVLQFALLLLEQRRDDKSAADGIGQVSAPGDTPIVADLGKVQEGVDAAAKAAQEIVRVDWESYDDEVEEAAALMTERYAKDYRVTAGDARQGIVDEKVQIEVSVVAQGAVRANLTRLQAMVFLNQYVSRVTDGKPVTAVTPYKVLVTVVHTDQGWLVDGLDAA